MALFEVKKVLTLLEKNNIMWSNSLYFAYKQRKRRDKMGERRKIMRTDLDAQLVIKRLDDTGVSNETIDVLDLSQTGIGFMCDAKLEMGAIYEGVLTIWTKEKIDVLFTIVRVCEVDGRYNYGGNFVGLSVVNKGKISTYQTVENNLRD